MKDLYHKLTEIKESFKSCGCCRVFCFNAEPDVAAVKMPILQLVFRPFGIFAEKIKLLFRLSAVFALILTALATLIGFNFLCMGPYRSAFFYCSDSDYLYLVYFFIKLFIISVFLARWYHIAFLNTVYNWKTLFVPTMKDVCAVGMLCLFLALNLMPMLSFYLLYIRVPNPDWIVETAYFAVVSLGFLVPFILMRYYSLIAFFLSNQKLPSLGCVWARSKGNNLGILLSLFLIVIVILFIFLNFQRGFQGVEMQYATYVGTVSEFFYNLVFLMLITLVVNNCYVQKELLFGEKDDGKNISR